MNNTLNWFLDKNNLWAISHIVDLRICRNVRGIESHDTLTPEFILWFDKINIDTV